MKMHNCLASLLAAALTLVCPLAQPARAATPFAPAQPAYDINAPLYLVTYSEAQKDAQRRAGELLTARINAAVAAHQMSFTIPPGVYRIPKALRFVGLKNFTLHMAGAEFLTGSDALLDLENCVNVAFIGPAKVDAAVYGRTQGVIQAYDVKTGLATLRLMPGYEVSSAAKGVVDAFSPDGVYLENPSWASYQNLTVLDAATRTAQVKLDNSVASQQIYKVGNLLSLVLHGTDNVIVSRNTNGFTLKDIDIYRSSGIGWGGGTGDWKFINVKGIRGPGTSRLAGSGGMQMSSNGGSVLIDACEFSTTADDIMDYGGSGTFMVVQQAAPRQVLTWRGSYGVGDTLNFYDHTDFHLLRSAKVVAVEELTDPALQAEAKAVVKNINKGRQTSDDQPLRRATLDRDVAVAPGNFVDNATSNRADQFTVRNTYFHDAGVRVMLQGFRHGLIENNTFERISGGLSLAVDFWWWGGPVNQDVTVRGNVFKHTTFRNGWGTGRAAVEVAAGEGPPDPTKGVAIHKVNISGNTFEDSSQAAIIVANADGVVIKNNVIRRAFTLGKPVGVIQLRSIDGAQIEGNIIADSPGEGIVIKNSHAVSEGHVVKAAP